MIIPRQQERIRHGLQWATIAVFLGLLWLPAFDSFFHWDKAPMPNENRAPARFPAFNLTIGGVRDFVAGLESYYNDHFGFRRRLIRWNNHWKHEVFNESNLPNVVTGRGGWLYYSGDDMIENCLGLTQFSPKELREWQSLLETRRDWLAKRGIRYLFVVTPNKESIYPEFLPEWMVKARPTTKLDQFFDYMKTNSTVEVLDLRPLLAEAKKTSLVYMVTDTHWNYDGAFIAHQELIRTLSRQLPGLVPLSLAAFKRTSIQKSGGDLARMLGQEQTRLETEYPSFTPLPPLAPLTSTTAPQLLPGKKWNKFMEPSFTENTNRTGTAILFRDSFAGFWVPFLGQYFGKVIYLSEENWEPAFIEKENPVVVIDELVERSFYTANPEELKTLDDLK
jgi:alginate O-acetyltransferase complex protein AlgJ